MRTAFKTAVDISILGRGRFRVYSSRISQLLFYRTVDNQTSRTEDCIFAFHDRRLWLHYNVCYTCRCRGTITLCVHWMHVFIVTDRPDRHWLYYGHQKSHSRLPACLRYPSGRLASLLTLALSWSALEMRGSLSIHESSRIHLDVCLLACSLIFFLGLTRKTITSVKKL